MPPGEGGGSPKAAQRLYLIGGSNYSAATPMPIGASKKKRFINPMPQRRFCVSLLRFFAS